MKKQISKIIDNEVTSLANEVDDLENEIKFLSSINVDEVNERIERLVAEKVSDYVIDNSSEPNIYVFGLLIHVDYFVRSVSYEDILMMSGANISHNGKWINSNFIWTDDEIRVTVNYEASVPKSIIDLLIDVGKLAKQESDYMSLVC